MNLRVSALTVSFLKGWELPGVVCVCVCFLCLSPALHLAHELRKYALRKCVTFLMQMSASE